MNKHVLMLTAATVALAAGQAQATNYSSITQKVTTNLLTSTANNGAASNITIGSGGSVQVTTGPAITIDSPHTVTNGASGLTSPLISASGDNAIGVQLNATGTGPGGVALDNFGTISLTGSGTGKTGILVTGTGTFNGGMTLETSSSLTVTGDDSAGIHSASTATLAGNITILGSLVANPTSLTSTTAGGATGILIDGPMNGNIAIGTAGVVQAYGYNARGLIVNGALTGSITNSGTLQAIGLNTGTTVTTTTTSTISGRPEAGSALVVAGNVTGGVYNAGPASTSDTTARATISAQGTAPAVLFSASTSNVAISPFSDATLGLAYDFINRGAISAVPVDVNDNAAAAVAFAGTSTGTLSLNEGVFNSGTIGASALTNSNATGVTTATAFSVGDYAVVGKLYNDAAESSSGTIAASVSGDSTAQATAIYISKLGSLAALTNTGTISASATTTDGTVSTLNAYAIRDLSGALQTITNSGTISATIGVQTTDKTSGVTTTVPTLDNGAQQAIALDLSANTAGVTLTNTGTITGDVLLGTGADAVSVSGASSASLGTITGNIAFGGGSDSLTVGNYGTVTGHVTEATGGTVNVLVQNGGTLNITNTTEGLPVSALDVQSGGTLKLALAQAFNVASTATAPAIVSTTSTAANAINLESGSTLGLTFGSYISTPGGTGGTSQFVLLDAPNGSLTLSNYTAASTAIQSAIPHLFTGGLCTYNVAGTTGCTTGSSTDSQLVLNLTPKSAATLGLTGNTAKIFDYANAALATDPALGGALLTYVTDNTSAQAAYASFLPDLSGSTRAVAISLTDQATGPVGARQRALRMYAGQDGGMTLWGQEFVQRLNSGVDTEGYRGSGFGFALGADGGDIQSGRYGGAFTFFSGDQTNKGPNFTKISNEWYMLTGYTDWRGKGLFLDSQLSVGYGRLNGKRIIQFKDSTGTAQLTRSAEGKRNGLLVAGGVSTGVVLTYGGTVLIPQVSLDGLSVREGGYTESGGGSGTAGADGFDLTVQSYTANSVRGYVGTALRQDIDLGGFYIQPEARAGYRYDFLADPVKLKAAFASVPNSTFSLTGPDPERGNMVAGGSLAVTTENWSIGVNYDYLRGSGGAVTQMGTLTLVGRL